MTIKWNWGTGITLVYSGFVVFMLGMVYLCTQQHFDLVTPDYYEQELKFQQVIDGQQNEMQLNRKTILEVQQDMVKVTLPTDKVEAGGTILFYRPDNARYDMVLPVSGTNTVMVPLSKFKAGVYKMKATWKSEGKPYFNEQSLIIP